MQAYKVRLGARDFNFRYLYLGFIFVVAFAPNILGISLDVITPGFPVGILVIVLGFVVTGIYARRTNSEFDELTNSIIRGIG